MMDTAAKMLPDAYGCAVMNRYGELLDEDGDPFDMISQMQTMKEQKKKKEEEERKKRAKQGKPGQKESQRERRLPQPGPVHKQQPACPAQAEESKEVQRDTTRAAFGERWAKQEVSPQEFSISRGRRGARGGGRGWYENNSENFISRNKREYDRHSATGISPEEKRGGRGPWNWGSVDETGKDFTETMSDTQVKFEEAQQPVEGEGPNSAMEEDKEMVVQVAVEMSLDEWKALQENSRSKAELNIRKLVDKIPKKAKVIHQSKCLENRREPVENMDEAHFLRRSVNDITSLLDINFGSLSRSRRGGRGRGAPGGHKRVSLTGKQEYNLAPNPDDPEDFPGLPSRKLHPCNSAV